MGEKRIGVAIADDRTPIAVPSRTIEAGADPVESVARLVEEEGAGVVVVGLPLSLSGAVGPQGQEVMSQAAQLEVRLSIPVHLWDERLTTTEAARSQLRRPGTSRSKPHGPGRDAHAAAIMLQAYLDSRR